MERERERDSEKGVCVCVCGSCMHSRRRGGAVKI